MKVRWKTRPESVQVQFAVQLSHKKTTNKRKPTCLHTVWH